MARRRRKKGTPKTRHIFVAVPTIDNRVTLGLNEFIIILERASRADDNPFIFSFRGVNGFSPVEYARNYLVGEFLKSDADSLWFIDADMLPDESAARLLYVEADICAGRMFRFDHKNPAIDTSKHPGVALCAMQRIEKTGKYAPLVPMVGDAAVQEVDAVGTGSMIIRRRVLEDRRMWFDGTYFGLTGEPADLYDEEGDVRYAPAVFRFPRKPNGQPIIGEDLDFCYRAKSLGYTIKVDIEAKFGHHKTVDLDQVVELAYVASTRAVEGQHARHPEMVASESRPVRRTDGAA